MKQVLRNPEIRKSLESLRGSLIAMIVGIFLSLIICACLGENPITVLRVLLRGSFGSLTNLGYSLYYATPLILTGLSVSYAFRLGLFNIGAEGQMAIGGLAAGIVGLYFPALSGFGGFVLIGVTAAFAGGIWGVIAGWLKAYRGAHEVLATILLNYVAYALVGYFVTGPFRNMESQSPETRSLPKEWGLSSLGRLGGQSPLNTSIILAVLIALVIFIVLKKSVFGFRQRFVGEAPRAAEYAGISSKTHILVGMAISGAVAGVASINELLGYSLKLREGFTAGAGFLGIAVALVGRTNPLGVVLSALFFGALQKGALDLDLDTENVTRDLAMVVQSMVIIAVVSEGGVRQWWAAKKERQSV